jgi:hypothetical protein
MTVLNLHDLSIRWKMILIISLTGTSTLVLACSAIIAYDRSSARDNLVSQIQTLAEITGGKQQRSAHLQR